MPYDSRTIGSALIVIWDKPEMGDVASVVNATRELRGRLGKPVTYIAYIPDTMATPEKSVREAMTKSFAVLREYCSDVIRPRRHGLPAQHDDP